MSNGWIKVHRKILENDWLSKNRVYSNFEAFMYLLLKANHKDGIFHIGTQIIEVKRGQLVTSQKKLCKQFNWSNSKLRNYLKTAKNASMIYTETTSKTTTLTICNYDTYQESSTEKTLKKESLNTEKALIKHTNNNVKNNKELTKDINVCDLFEDWWKMYDRKVHKKASKYQWGKLTEDEKKIVLQHTKIFTEFTEHRFRPHPHRYLRDKRFNDEIQLNDLQGKHTLEDFKTDGGGMNKIGYCSKCNKSDFYTPYEILNAESRCCNVNVLPKKEEDHVNSYTYTAKKVVNSPYTYTARKDVK